MLRRKQPAPPASESPKRIGNEFGWRAHEAIQGWTASVDIKASIVVLLETAVASGALRALITKKGALHTADGLHLATAITAVVLLVLAVACALWVVFPRLERRRNAGLAPNGLIYFGHVRARSPAEIAAALEALTPEQERHQLATQLHITGKVAWHKHTWLQRSLMLLAPGAILLILSLTAF